MSKQQKIIVSVTNDLHTDQRVHKVCLFLQQQGFDVTLVGRKLTSSGELKRPYACKRFRLWFNKGFLFYANYNLRLCCYLLVHRADVLLSNDLDTLYANYIASKLKGTKLVYDSHEYFTEVPELIGRPKVKRFWERIEKRIFPKLKKVYTVNESIAEIYQKKYHVPVEVVKNVPLFEAYVDASAIREARTIIYQGSVNKDRGLEELLQAMSHLSDVRLVIVGGGDVLEDLKQQAADLKITDRVTFTGKIPFEELKTFTRRASLGLSLEKGGNLNYELALPNKLFDYLACGIPVLVSALPEMKKVLDSFEVGLTISSHDPEEIADKIQSMLSSTQWNTWHENAIEAAKTYCWEQEQETLKKIFLT